MSQLGYREWLLISLAAWALLAILVVCYYCCYCIRKKKLCICSCFRRKKLSNAENPNIDENVVVEGGAASGTHNIEVQEGGAIQMGEVNVAISLQDLRIATNNFSVANVVGEGAPAVVYKGVCNGVPVTVKRMLSNQGGITTDHQVKQFESELVALSKVRHRNLISMLGYNLTQDEKILVLEYMSNGTLANRLCKWHLDGLQPLVWKERLDIALDVVRGVEYLHCLAKEVFIHRDLKSSNMLLGDDLTAKVAAADFGLIRCVLVEPWIYCTRT